MDLSQVDSRVGVFVVFNFAIWLIQFIVLKTDMKWIKDRVRTVDVLLSNHNKAISENERNISTLKAVCRNRHSGHG
jgi:hypothetical protein